jgi:hypothetical protein
MVTDGKIIFLIGRCFCVSRRNTPKCVSFIQIATVHGILFAGCAIMIAGSETNTHRLLSRQDETTNGIRTSWRRRKLQSSKSCPRYINSLYLPGPLYPHLCIVGKCLGMGRLSYSAAPEMVSLDPRRCIVPQYTNWGCNTNCSEYVCYLWRNPLSLQSNKRWSVETGCQPLTCHVWSFHPPRSFWVGHLGHTALSVLMARAAQSYRKFRARDANSGL